ncbi:predicted protein [Naegleria gruberi]|uniref:Phospholipid-transporting ATPase n=1 Tax=Naegleria gruberi TaxID=5762 RepID=D2VJA8_NAEGR|nr:uncharacterized protein NAEGRDRAFT_68970 [Naegleria gruberi]EFC43248.1 predicted protein [Naegleria gruberi]|eukprot:XP_002675992.1 predicted protein [Naegleria gruberi strain NEG-M]
MQEKPISFDHQQQDNYPYVVSINDWQTNKKRRIKKWGFLPFRQFSSTNYLSTTKGGEDFFRYLKDRKVNHKKVLVLKSRSLKQDGNSITQYLDFVEIYTKHVKVGDLVKIEEDEEFPADLLLVSSNFEDGSCNIETANLDGESALKSRYSPHSLSKFNNIDMLKDLKGWIKCQMPDHNLYKFKGSVCLEGENNEFGINHQNLLLKGAKLKSPHIYGIVIYAGKDTKVARNVPNPKVKFSHVNLMGNFFTVVLFIFMTVIISILVILNAYYEFTYSKNVAYLGKLKPMGISDGLWVVHSILVYIAALNVYVPASLFVVLEFLKIIQARFISADNELVHRMMDVHTGEEKFVSSAAISSDLHSDLARIELILTDKTGTLTENEMKLKKIWAVGHSSFNCDSSIEESIRNGQQSRDSLTKLMLMLNISLCHNVTIRKSKERETYDGESSDEVALVQGISNYGFILKYFSDKKTILSLFEKEYTFERLAELEFTPERKRMSVLFKIPKDFLNDYPIIQSATSTIHNSNGESDIVLCLTKGADSFVYPFMEESAKENRQLMEDRVMEFSKDGLRSLVFAFKFVGNDQLKQWMEDYHALKTKSLNHDEQLELSQRLEKEMEVGLLPCGVTGIEDVLQQLVPETVKFFTEAGLKIWMLTGDAKESALHIARCSKLIEKESDLILLDSSSVKEENIHSKLSEILQETESRDNVELAVEGHFLHICEKPDTVSLLVKLLQKCKTVICFRSTPKQKSRIVELARHKLKKNCLAIGDGANDVPMILKSQVGVGIIGKEGTLAKQSSDYAIPKFHMLKRLLAVHGRYSYKRSAVFIQYSFYKSNVVSSLMTIYFFYNLCSGQLNIESLVLTFQNYVFTLVNPIVFGLFEKDIDESYLEDSETGPILYRKLKTDNIFNWYTFSKWVFGAFLHGTIIFFFCTYAAEPGLLTNGQSDGIWAMCALLYTCVFVVITLKCYIEMEHLTIIHHAGMIFSILSFVIFVVIFTIIQSSMTSVWFEAMRSPKFWLILLLCTVTCLGIDIALTGFKNMVWPDYYQKLKMKSRKLKRTMKDKESNLELASYSTDTIIEKIN